MTNAYPFADIELARRLERAEAHGNVEFVEARKRAFPDRDAAWIEVAGAHAMFDGVGSPVTQTFGLGVFEPITPEQLNEIERFFRSRGAEVLAHSETRSAMDFGSRTHEPSGDRIYKIFHDLQD